MSFDRRAADHDRVHHSISTDTLPVPGKRTLTTNVMAPVQAASTMLTSAAQHTHANTPPWPALPARAGAHETLHAIAAPAHATGEQPRAQVTLRDLFGSLTEHLPPARPGSPVQRSTATVGIGCSPVQRMRIGGDDGAGVGTEKEVSTPPPALACPPGADQKDSALAEVYDQLRSLGFDTLEQGERDSVWKRVQDIDAEAQRVFGVEPEEWNDLVDRNKMVHFGLLFSPIRAPSALLSETQGYNEINVDTSDNDIVVRSVFLVDAAAQAARTAPESFASTQAVAFDAIRYAHEKGLRVHVPSQDQAGPPASHPHTPQPGFLDRSHEMQEARDELAGPELGEWDALNTTRDAQVSGPGRPIAMIGDIPIYEAPMALVTLIEVGKTEEMEFYKQCVEDEAFHDRGGMRCASLVGPGGGVVFMQNDGVVALELDAKPSRLMAIAPSDLQSPDPDLSSIDIVEYLQLAAQAQLVAQHVHVMAATPTTTMSPTTATTTTTEHLDDDHKAIQLVRDPATEDRTDVHAAAARGVATPATSLPHLDQIQRLFGRHDVSSVKVHTGADAAASARDMGARAYATEDHVVLGGVADLHTVAHEAAHVVQQRAGVQLKGGVGVEGDIYERHANAVADLVVAGQSAESLLDPHGGDPASAGLATSGSAVQRAVGFEFEFGDVETYRFVTAEEARAQRGPGEQSGHAPRVLPQDNNNDSCDNDTVEASGEKDRRQRLEPESAVKDGKEEKEKDDDEQHPGKEKEANRTDRAVHDVGSANDHTGKVKEALDKHSQVFPSSVTGAHFTADDPPAGKPPGSMSDLELKIDEFDDSDSQNAEKLRKTLTGAQRALVDLEALRQACSESIVPAEMLRGASNVFLHAPNGLGLAQFQATAGLDSEALANVLSGRTLDDVICDIDNKRLPSQVGEFLNLGGTVRSEIWKAAEHAAQKLAPKVAPGEQRALASVVSLILQILYGARTPALPYPKSAAGGLMARTDLGSIIAQLPPAVTKVIANDSATWADAILAELNDLYKSAIEEGDMLAVNMQDRVFPELQLEIRPWLHSLAASIDLLTAASYPYQGEGKKLESMGGFGDRMDPARGPKEPERPVFEFRALGMVAVSDLVEAGMAAWNYVARAHTQKSAKKRWSLF